MEKEKISNATTEQMPAPVTGDKDAEANSYGKFKSKEELVNAYNSLEAEFTRRSQRIKELENTQGNRKLSDKWTERVNDLREKYPIANELTEEISDYLSQNRKLLKDESCLEKALLAVLASGKGVRPTQSTEKAATAEAEKDKIIAEYLAELSRVKTPAIPDGGGEIPVAEPIRVTTLEEATALAKKAFNKLK